MIWTVFVAVPAVRVRLIAASLHALPVTQRGGLPAPVRTSVVNPGEVLTCRRSFSGAPGRVAIHVRTDARLRALHLRCTVSVRVVVCTRRKQPRDVQSCEVYEVNEPSASI